MFLASSEAGSEVEWVASLWPRRARRRVFLHQLFGVALDVLGFGFGDEAVLVGAEELALPTSAIVARMLAGARLRGATKQPRAAISKVFTLVTPSRTPC